ncbi:MAG: hypothetical protein GWO07_01545, partial [Candidatus Dadabacteria bacterium]|nr:hypothetical protein [Candidatus Dadabacteria bacterium]NIV66027.1 hypothetical protein [Nitrosopumilaceae archaeon]NIX14314.1 hypothetical protein [Candidatus Dadabacteria bacterium]
IIFGKEKEGKNKNRYKENLGEIIWNKRNPKGDSKAVAIQHEYVLTWTKDFKKFKQSNNFVKLKDNAGKMMKKASNIFEKVQ